MAAGDEARQRARAPWAAGDWDSFAWLISPVGALVLDRVGLEPGLELLDVGTGSGGNIAIPAALRGAKVTGIDITADLLEHARRRAADAGVEVEWLEGDAAELPFADASFDRVVSTFGAMFAPDHAKAAAELARVCRHGGRIAMTTWASDGMAGELFKLSGRFLPPPPPGVGVPPQWGNEAHIHEMFGAAGVTVSVARESVEFEYPSVEAMVETYSEGLRRLRPGEAGARAGRPLGRVHRRVHQPRPPLQPRGRRHRARQFGLPADSQRAPRGRLTGIADRRQALGVRPIDAALVECRDPAGLTATMNRVAVEPGDKNRFLLVLGAGPAQLGLLEAAQLHGVRTAVCDRNPAAPGFVFADRRCIVSLEDEPAIERLASALPLGGLIAPGKDPPVAVAARVADKLGLAHPLSPLTAQLATSKLRQREALAAAAVPQPRWQIASGETTACLELPLPVVVKAADRTGRSGLALVRTAAQLGPAIAAARAESRGGAVLIEEYVDGPEVTVTGFSAEGVFVPLAVMDRHSGEGDSVGIPLAYTWPSAHAEAAAEVTRRAVEALGIEEGPTQTHLRMSRGGPEVIEVAARLGGGHDAALVELVTGIDLNGLAIAVALGRPLAASEIEASFRTTVGGAATRFLIAPPGLLESVEVPQGLKGVVSTRLYREPGHVFGPFRRPSDRAGAVLAAGSSAGEALARVDTAVERIRFSTFPVDEVAPRFSAGRGKAA